MRRVLENIWTIINHSIIVSNMILRKKTHDPNIVTTPHTRNGNNWRVILGSPPPASQPEHTQSSSGMDKSNQPVTRTEALERNINNDKWENAKETFLFECHLLTDRIALSLKIKKIWDCVICVVSCNGKTDNCVEFFVHNIDVSQKITKFFGIFSTQTLRPKVPISQISQEMFLSFWLPLQASLKRLSWKALRNTRTCWAGAAFLPFAIITQQHVTFDMSIPDWMRDRETHSTKKATPCVKRLSCCKNMSQHEMITTIRIGEEQKRTNETYCYWCVRVITTLLRPNCRK